MSETKIVLFTQRVEIVPGYEERRDCADQRIADFLKECGYLPIPIPNQTEIAEKMVHYLSPVGIVLTGGNSLLDYGGNAPERDATDEILIRICIEKRIPLYGFCRGMQSVLHYYGIALENVKGHVACNHEIYGVIKEYVNSYHNQACMRLPENSVFEKLAVSEDGVVEAIKHRDLPILCTMWHPEREKPYRQQDVNRIKEFFH